MIYIENRFLVPLRSLNPLLQHRGHFLFGLPRPYCYPPKKYNSTKICKYHVDTPRHGPSDCKELKECLQGLIDHGVVTFIKGEKPKDVVITITREPTHEVLDEEEILPSLSIYHYTLKEAKKF